MSPPFTQLTPDLWVTQSQFFRTNSGVFISQGQAALIDPCMRPEEIEGIARFVKEQGAIPDWLILTHSHWDHLLGPEHFPGVRTVAHTGYPKEVNAYDTGIRREITKWEARERIERRTPFVIPRPDETYEDTLTLAIGRLSLRLMHAPGHAPDQLVVYHADRATLWASDLLSDVEIPFVSDSLISYERTLAQLSGWDIRALIPGHGCYATTTDPADIRARLADDRAYLAEVHVKVEQAVRAGQTVEEAVAACAAMTYRCSEENESNHRLNVESAYLEFGGQADPHKVGYKQDWPE